ncbi:MAG TPA: MG2 domain-containing protein [Mucilaginibacter sp.]|jgi:hypothetical protein|nr:MG2 domain-containing protein [Mucilaginibacter sp.]
MSIIKPTTVGLLLFAACAAGVSTGNAQVIQEVQNSFNLYKQSALQEKIFVHTDKNVYLPGEILWFKVYCVDGENHKPINISKVVYLDVLDNNQSRIVEAKVALNNGEGDGSLYIPVTVSNGNYKLRAYTNWMKNFSPEYYFEKEITLINPLKIPEKTVISASSDYDIQFFPEGGNLVAGLKSVVAFKAVGRDGNGAEVSGIVLDAKNDTVARFKSMRFGMGNFSFTPAAAEAYRAVVKVDGEQPVTKPLPDVNSRGYVMALTDNGGADLNLSVASTDNTAGNVYLFVHTGKIVKIAESTVIANGSARFSISKDQLGYGVSHFTIFNSTKQPVCERLYFKRPPHQLLITAGADQQQYAGRKRVSVSVSAKDPSGKSLAADMSMAVYRVDSLQSIDERSIFSYLWLSSDLKGHIESPDYYFKNVNTETDEALDNLLLTQGWSRFTWNDVLDNKTPAFNFLPEYGGHIINAKIVATQTNAPAKGIIAYLGVPGKRVQLYTAQSDSLGRLSFFTKDLYGPGEVIAQTNELIDSTYRIDLLSPFSEQYSHTSYPAFQFHGYTARALQEHSLGIQALNIYTGNLLKQYFNPVTDSSAFYGTPYKSYKLDDFTRFTTMEEDLREYVSEDNIVNTRGNFHIKVLNNHGFLDGDPLCLVDGVPVFNINKIFTIDPLKVRKLEVVPFRYYYGPAEAEGVFSFTTYKGDLGGVELDPRAIVVDYEGMQLHREFYSPVYDTEAQAASRIPDFRNVLYWSPAVNTGSPVSFYTSDQPGKYVGVVQGLTANGDAGSQYFMFEVK